MFKNLENEIKFHKGDIIVPDLSKKSRIMYTEEDYYIVVSNYIWYARDTCSVKPIFKNMLVHLSKFKNEDVFLYGGWKVRVKSIKTGKYKFFEEEDMKNIEDTYLRLTGDVRDIKLSLLL